MAAAPIDGDDAAHRRHVAHRWVGAELAAHAAADNALRRSWTTPGWTAHAFGLDAQDAAKVAGEIEHQPRPERFAGQAGSRAAGVDRQLILAARTGRRRPRRPVERGRTTPSGLIWYMLASLAYSCKKTSSQRTSPAISPRRSSWIRSRCWSITRRFQ